MVRLRILGETTVKVCVGMNQMKKGCQGRKYTQTDTGPERSVLWEVPVIRA